MAHLHEMWDKDTHYIINPQENMAITNANGTKNKLQLGDHASEIYTFEIPKVVEGHDMSLCNMVEVHYINVSADKTSKSEGVFKVTDMSVAEDSADTLIFTWKVEGNATMYAGSLNFRIKFACIDENGNYTYKKWSAVYKGITIDDGFDNGEAVAMEHTDILAQWEARIAALESGAAATTEKMDELQSGIDVVADWEAATGNSIKNPLNRIKSLTPTITFIDDDTVNVAAVTRFHSVFDKFKSAGKNLYDKTAKTDGYTLHSQNGSNYETENYSVSDYIAIKAESVYTFSVDGMVAETWRINKVCFYDSNKTFISIVSSPSSPFTTPANAAYLRFSASTDRMNGVDTNAPGKIQLEEGETATAYEEFVKDERNVKGCYGVITYYVENNANLKNLLLSYEDEGFGMLFHADRQNDDDGYSSVKRNLTEAEKNYCAGIRKMRTMGFTNFNYWVAPYGVKDEDMQNLCKRHGAECLLSTSNKAYMKPNGLDSNNEMVSRYALHRCSLNIKKDEEGNDDATIAEVKNLITACASANGWIIVTTHAWQWGEDSYADSKLAEIINYALGNGLCVKTFAEAYEDRKALFMLNELL